jgi:F-type H+-transporting ATPase subunit a
MATNETGLNETKVVTGAEETHTETKEATGPHISIKGEEIATLGGFAITNSILATALVLVGFIFLARYYASQAKSKTKSYGFYAMNGMLKAIYDLFKSVLNEKIYTFFPLLGAFFFFILLNNWSGLIPGVGSLLIKTGEHTVPLLRGGTADLNTTLTLAAITVFITQYFGFRYLGTIKHLGKYFNFKDPVMFFVGILELILEFARVISFAFRLYGNIFAGEVLLTVVAFLLPVYLSFVGTPMFFMEIFVGLVQALVFTMLSTVFINMAIADHH